MMDSSKEFHYDILPSLFPSHTRIIFIEALGALVPSGRLNDYHTILRFYKGLFHICRKHDLTLIGTDHQPKLKDDESFTHPRDKVLGSVAWAACSDTVILIEPENSKNPHRRRMTILPRNESHFEHSLDFDQNGRLLIMGDDEGVGFLLDQELGKLPEGDILPTKTAQGWGELHKISERAVERWLASGVETGKLERKRPGMYKVRKIN